MANVVILNVNNCFIMITKALKLCYAEGIKLQNVHRHNRMHMLYSK